MKGKKLSIALITSFIAALGMSSCTNVTPKGSTILTLTGFDGKAINIDAQQIYDKFKQGEDGVSNFYKAILEVLIRNYFVTSTDAKSKLEELKGRAQKKVDGVKETANSNASTNGTSYSYEFDKLCKETYHVKDETGLYQYFLYQLEEEEAKDAYFNKVLTNGLTNEFIGFEYDKNASTWKPFDVSKSKHTSSYPYHIKHILVKTSAAAGDFSTSTITSAEAKNLATVYQKLASGNSTFGEVAVEKSEDGSASTFGDSGIMSTSTSFVNEFKLGTYAFDALYNNTGDSNLTKTDYFGLNGYYQHAANDTTTIAQEYSTNVGLKEVSFEVFNRLDEVKDEVTSTEGLTVNNGAEKYYPRNVYWNYFLNNHAPFIVVDNGHDLGDGDPYDTSKAPKLLESAGKAGFRKVKINGAVKKVLTDELGRIIYLVRSEYGIHFMVAQRTPFETTGTIVGYDSDNTLGLTYKYNGVTIDNYYTTKTPSDNGYPIDPTTSDPAITYVNWFNSDQTTKNSRAEDVKTAIKGFDSLYDYRLYEDLMGEGNVKIHTNDGEVDIGAEITKFIANKRSYNKYNDINTQNTSWESYLDLLNQQNTAFNITWKDTNNGADMHRYVNLVCARKFKSYDPYGADWVKGGACYYAK